MLQLDAYLDQLRVEVATDRTKKELLDKFAAAKKAYNLFDGGNPDSAFETFVECYNWFGKNKARSGVSQNMARNLVGALMQDWLVHLLNSLLKDYEKLQIFTEVQVRFGYYPLWSKGEVKFKTPAERSDLSIGLLVKAANIEEVLAPTETWPRPVLTAIPPGSCIVPLITINSKIRISQSEFFDWQGRETLMTKGNPHCLSLQVALRKEMDLNIVEAAQAHDRWFLLGAGNETNVVPHRDELERLCETVKDHLFERMKGHHSSEC